MTFRIVFLFLCLQSLVLCSVKRGVGISKHNFICTDLDVLNTMGWWYDWGCNFDEYLDPERCGSAINAHEYNYVPMIWGFGPNQNYNCPYGQYDYVLGPNEPNHAKQSNLSPQEAADEWIAVRDHVSPRVLVSPSAAGCSDPNCNFGNTTEWFDEFFNLCVDCDIEFLATHTYWCGVDKTMDHLEDLYNRYNRKIWLTEFTCNQVNNNPDRVYDFLAAILPRLEAAPFIDRYSYYMMRITNDTGWVKTSSSLMEPDSSTLTAIGELYRDYVYIP